MNKTSKGKVFKFYPKAGRECGVCGIVSFAHLHRYGTLPKDFERIEKPSQAIHGQDIGKLHMKPSQNFFDLSDKEKKIILERVAKESSAEQVRKYGKPSQQLSTTVTPECMDEILYDIGIKPPQRENSGESWEKDVPNPFGSDYASKQDYNESLIFFIKNLLSTQRGEFLKSLKEIVADAEFAGCYDYDVIAEKVLSIIENS